MLTEKKFFRKFDQNGLFSNFCFFRKFDLNGICLRKFDLNRNFREKKSKFFENFDQNLDFFENLNNIEIFRINSIIVKYSINFGFNES